MNVYLRIYYTRVLFRYYKLRLHILSLMFNNLSNILITRSILNIVKLYSKIIENCMKIIILLFEIEIL